MNAIAGFNRPKRALAVFGIVVALACPLPAEETSGDEQIRQLIRDLNSNTYRVRRASTAKLIELGDAALPQLEKATKNPSAEVRARARRIVHFTLFGKMRGRFIKLASAKQDKDIDLERGMWLISRVVGPRVKQEVLTRQLDDLASRVRKHLQKQHGNDVDPAKLSPAKAVAGLRHVLFTELGFNGNTDDYDNPINSSLYHVLKTRKGLPILLSHVVVAVARRLKIPIVGLAVPGRYMCKYDGTRAPGGRAADIIINPFEAGKMMTPADLAQWTGRINGLSPDGHRSALSRMLTNLASDYDHVGNGRMARLVREYEAVFEEPERAP